MTKRRLISWMLALTLLLCTVPVFAAETPWLVKQQHTDAPAFADLEGSWCREAAETVYQAGLMQGVAQTRFDAASPLTHAQIVVICARLHSLLAGGTGDVSAPAGSPWYLGGYQVLWQILDRHTLFCPMYLASDPVNYTREADTPCTREDFVRTLSYVLLDANVTLPQINAVTALPDVAEEDTFGSVSKDVLDLYRAGVLTGIDAYGTFRGAGTLNRGQAAAILARLADPSQRQTLRLQSFDLCQDVMGLEPDTVLATVDGLDITAEQAALVMTHSTGPAAVLSDLRHTVAMLRLVQAQDPGWTPSALEADGAALAGYRGVRAKGWVWDSLDTALFTVLNGAPPDPHAAADGFYDALNARIQAKEAVLTADASPALEAFDFSAFAARLKASPFQLY